MDISRSDYTKIASSLDKGTVPAELQRFIGESVGAVTKKVSVSCLEKGRKWLIKDQQWQRIVEVVEQANRSRSVIQSPHVSGKQFKVQLLPQ